MQWARILLICSSLPIGLTKVSVVLPYQRIFLGKFFNIMSRTMLGISILWTVANFFGAIFQCGDPISTHPVPGQKCMYEFPFYYIVAGSDFVIDLVIILMPIPLIWNLQMPPMQKTGVTGIFLCGLL
jgi:hypothetical protein